MLHRPSPICGANKRLNGRSNSQPKISQSVYQVYLSVCNWWWLLCRREYCVRVEDFLARRTRLAFLDVAAAEAAVNRVSQRWSTVVNGSACARLPASYMRMQLLWQSIRQSTLNPADMTASTPLRWCTTWQQFFAFQK
jgi:hypothetical protein